MTPTKGDQGCSSHPFNIDPALSTVMHCTCKVDEDAKTLTNQKHDEKRLYIIC
jgi:hypothetical protein